MSRFLNTFPVLYGMQIKIFRQIGTITILISFVLPLMLIFFLKMVFSKMMPAQGLQRESLILLLSGNVLLSLSNISVILLSQTLASMKESRTFEYFAVLPVPALSFSLSIVFSYLTISAPGILFVLYGGSKLLSLSVSFSPVVLLVLLLSLLSFVGIGSLIGMYARNQLEANLLANVLGFGLIMLAPVFYPLAILPRWYQPFAYLFPHTHASIALQSVLLGKGVQELCVPLFALFLMAAASLAFSSQKMLWRER